MANVSLIDGHVDGKTNIDRIKNMSVEELAKFLCDNIECDTCFASEHCWLRHNGMKVWLESEVAAYD